MQILAIDTGTTKTGYCIMDSETLKLIEFGKVDNEVILDVIRTFSTQGSKVVFERFSPQSTMGRTVVDAIVWYGRFVQECVNHQLEYHEIYRREVKKHLLGKVDKSKGSADSQVRKALVARLAKFDFASGKGTKDNPDALYGVSTTDVYASIAVVLTYIDKQGDEISG